MKALLINPPSKFEKSTPLPLGLLYIASYLEKNGHKVKIIDMKVEEIPLSKLKMEILDFGPDYIGIKCLTYEAKTVYSLSDFIKKIDKKYKIVLGGPHASANPREVINEKSVDYVVSGEGEITFEELLEGITPSKIKGLVYKAGKSIKENPPREFIQDLDKMPLPAYHLIEVKKYFNNPYAHAFFKARKNISQIFTSRGCPFQCIYCHKIFGKTIRYHSAERVLKEIHLLYNLYGVREFQIEDDSFNVDMNRAKKIMSLIKQSGMKIKISFPNGIRADFIDEDLVRKMRDAGVYSICFGVESGDKEIQKFIRKNLNLEKVNAAIKLSTKYGILTTGYFMMGFLDETKKQMMNTIQFAKNSKLHMATFFKVIPYPNTELYSLAKERGLTLSNNPGDYTYTFSTMKDIKMSKVDSQELDSLIKKAYFSFFSPLRMIRLGLKAPNKSMLFVHFFRLLFWKN